MRLVTIRADVPAPVLASPVSSWLDERCGSRHVFLAALALFTVSSLLYGLAVSPTMRVAARLPQGIAAASCKPFRS
ncbi:MAG: hypothetical protein ABJB17_01020 [Burkholderiales bacterium]